MEGPEIPGRVVTEYYQAMSCFEGNAFLEFDEIRVDVTMESLWRYGVVMPLTGVADEVGSAL